MADGHHGSGTAAVDPNSLIVCFSCCGWLGCADTLSLNGYIGNWCSMNLNVTLCCVRSGCVTCRGSDIEGECCQMFELDIKQVMPSACCKTTGQTCCLDQRIAFPAEDDETKEIPCVCAIGGINCALEWQARFGCCQTIQTLRSGEVSSEGWPFVFGTVGDCSCISACCKKPEEVTPTVASETGVSNPKQAGMVDHIPQNDPTVGTPDKITVGQSLGSALDNLGTGTAKEDDIPDVRDLNTCAACCCFIQSIYCQFPEVFGCFGEGICCGCLKSSVSACKPLIKQGEVFDADICLLLRNRVACQFPDTCCGYINQTFCLDSRCMLPPDAEKVPCVMNYCCINCVYDYEPACGCTLWSPLRQFVKEEGMASQQT